MIRYWWYITNWDILKIRLSLLMWYVWDVAVILVRYRWDSCEIEIRDIVKSWNKLFVKYLQDNSMICVRYGWNNGNVILSRFFLKYLQSWLDMCSIYLINSGNIWGIYSVKIWTGHWQESIETMKRNWYSRGMDQIL